MAFDNQAGIENYKSTLKVQIFADVPEAHQEFIGRTASFLSDLTKRQHFLSLYSFYHFI